MRLSRENELRRVLYRAVSRMLEPPAEMIRSDEGLTFETSPYFLAVVITPSSAKFDGKPSLPFFIDEALQFL